MIIVHNNEMVRRWLVKAAELDGLKVDGVYSYASDELVRGKVVWGVLPVGRVELCAEYWHVSFPNGVLSEKYLDENCIFARTVVLDGGLLDKYKEQIKNLFSIQLCGAGYKAQCPKCKYTVWEDEYSSAETWALGHRCNV